MNNIITAAAKLRERLVKAEEAHLKEINSAQDDYQSEVGRKAA
jgi:ubiquitin